MYALVDCNNFYVSCERVFAPQLRQRPVVVLSNNDGCIISRSEEAKALGIKMGEPAFKIEEFLERHGVAVFSSNYTLYGDMSQRVMNTLARFAPAIEVYSIDEAFLDLRDWHRLGDLLEYGLEIRRRVGKETGIPVSVGIGATKTLAKVANHLAKRYRRQRGVVVLQTADQVTAALRFTPIEEVWGIGRQYAKLLHRRGVNTAYDFIRLPAKWVKQHLSIVGLRTQLELKGEVRLSLEETPPPKKSICTSRSFGHLQTEYSALEEAVATYAQLCAHKLRREQAAAHMIMVFLHTNSYIENEPQYACNQVITLPVATNSTFEIVRYALQALSVIYQPGYRYKKAGVLVSGLVPENTVQGDLFDFRDRRRERRLMREVDRLNQRYGRATVALAVQGQGKRWRLRQEKLSPRYTTRWDELMVVGK